MRKLILDANVAIKWCLPEIDSDRALRLRDDFQKQIVELLSPDVLPIEVAHALTRAERKGLIPVGEAMVKLTDVLNTAPVLHSYLPLLPRAVEISSQARIGVFDCLYVALAEQEGCELVTADSKLTKALPGYPIIDLSTLP